MNEVITPEKTAIQVDKIRSPNRKPRTRGIEPKTRKIDLPKALELRQKGLTEQEIADLFHCTKQAVSKALKPYADLFNGEIEVFKKNRADLFASTQRELLESFDPSDIKKMNVKDRVIALGIMYDKERLERGQSTSNLSIMTRAVEAACDFFEDD